MRSPHSLALVALVAVGSVTAAPLAARAGDEPSARDIFLKQEAARSVKELVADASITTGTGSDAKRKAFTWSRKLGPDGVHFKTLTRFHEPAEIRGEGILVEEKSQGESSIQLYLPAYKKVRRVEGQSQATSFMGSVFSYADMATPHADDYRIALLRSEACPGEAKVSCHVLELVPVSDVVRERTGYAKSIEWVRSDNFVAVQAESFDASGALWKRLSATDIREVDAKEHKWFAHKVKLEDVKAKRTSVLEFTQVKVNGGIPDSTFTVQNLSRE